MFKVFTSILIFIAIQSYSQKLPFEYNPISSEKNMIEDRLKVYEKTLSEPKKLFLPAVSKIDFYRLNKNDFLSVVADPIYKEMKQYSFYDIGNKLSNGQRALYYLLHLDNEVNNGGFEQFIYNSRGDYFLQMLEGLKLIGDTQVYSVIEKVYLFSIREPALKNRASILDYVGDKNEKYERDFLVKANKEYYRLNYAMYSKLETYIRKNPNKIVQEIDPKYTGTYKETNSKGVTKSIDLVNGIANGYYLMFHKDTLMLERIKYEFGEITETEEYLHGILNTKKMYSLKDSIIKIQEFCENGNLKSLKIEKIKDRHNNKAISDTKYYCDGKLRREFYTDENQVLNIKTYFSNGKIRTYKKTWLDKGAPTWSDRNHLYLIGYDKNGQESLKDGNGIFYEYDVDENSNPEKYMYEVNCKKYLSDGVSKGYKNGILWLVTNYSKGKKDGLSTEYDKDGKIIWQSNYKNGVANK